MNGKRINSVQMQKRILICILSAALILILALPSFAANSEESTVQNETTTEQAGKTANEENEETEIPEEKQNEETVEETADDKTEPAEDKNESVPAVPKAAASEPESGLPANNSKVSYTSAGSHPVKFTVKNGSYTFRGTCATLGVNNAKSGKATVKRISNTSKIAKLIYYYGYKKGWWLGTNSTKKATTVLGFTDKNCTENAKQCIEALIQRDNMGWDKFWAARKVGGYRMYSTDSFMRQINNLYKNTDVSKITIPDDVVFEIFHGVTSSSKQQDFYVWRYKKVLTIGNGFVAVEKVSGDVSITD